MSGKEKVVITCAVTGSMGDAKTPYIPNTPEQTAQSAMEAARSLLLGGNVRVGIKDNLHLAKGVRAKSNAELVAKAAGIIRSLGKETAAASGARILLGLE